MTELVAKDSTLIPDWRLYGYMLADDRIRRLQDLADVGDALSINAPLEF